jgi:hypothetical protein
LATSVIQLQNKAIREIVSALVSIMQDWAVRYFNIKEKISMNREQEINIYCDGESFFNLYQIKIILKIGKKDYSLVAGYQTNSFISNSWCYTEEQEPIGS